MWGWGAEMRWAVSSRRRTEWSGAVLFVCVSGGVVAEVVFVCRGYCSAGQGRKAVGLWDEAVQHQVPGSQWAGTGDGTGAGAFTARAGRQLWPEAAPRGAVCGVRRTESNRARIGQAQAANHRATYFRRAKLSTLRARIWTLAARIPLGPLPTTSLPARFAAGHHEGQLVSTAPSRPRPAHPTCSSSRRTPTVHTVQRGYRLYLPFYCRSLYSCTVQYHRWYAFPTSSTSETLVALPLAWPTTPGAATRVTTTAPPTYPKGNKRRHPGFLFAPRQIVFSRLVGFATRRWRTSSSVLQDSRMLSPVVQSTYSCGYSRYCTVTVNHCPSRAALHCAVPCAHQLPHSHSGQCPSDKPGCGLGTAAHTVHCTVQYHNHTSDRWNTKVARHTPTTPLASNKCRNTLASLARRVLRGRQRRRRCERESSCVLWMSTSTPPSRVGATAIKTGPPLQPFPDASPPDWPTATIPNRQCFAPVPSKKCHRIASHAHSFTSSTFHRRPRRQPPATAPTFRSPPTVVELPIIAHWNESEVRVRERTLRSRLLQPLSLIDRARPSPAEPATVAFHGTAWLCVRAAIDATAAPSLALHMTPTMSRTRAHTADQTASCSSQVQEPWLGMARGELTHGVGVTPNRKRRSLRSG